jgi:hypothetical protein
VHFMFCAVYSVKILVQGKNCLKGLFPLYSILYATILLIEELSGVMTRGVCVCMLLFTDRSLNMVVDRVVDTGLRLQLGKASFANLPKTEVKFEGNGWFIPNTPFHGKEKASAPIFSCPRILCHPVTLPKDIPIDVLSPGLRISPQVPGHAEQQKDTAEVKGNMGERDWSLSPFTEWLLDIAMGSPSLGVKFEATAIIGLLVVHSEPLVERVQ